MDDGTTTSTILAHTISAEGVRNIVAGESAVDLKRGLDRGLEATVAALRSMAKPMTLLCFTGTDADSFSEPAGTPLAAQGRATCSR